MAAMTSARHDHEAGGRPRVSVVGAHRPGMGLSAVSARLHHDRAAGGHTAWPR